MTRAQTIGITGLALLALSALQACTKTTEPDEISSGSNWLTCETLDDCGDGRAVSCSDDGYCLDADDQRIPVAGPDASVERPAATGSAGSTSSASDPIARLDASVAFDGGQGTTVPENDAARPPISGTASSACDEPGAHDPLIPRNDETCYTFAVHGASSETDTTPFTISIAESYNQFYYAVPWPAGTVATRYGVVDDAQLSVHAWLFSVAAPGSAPGTVATNVTGTLLGENARMLGAWAKGGCNVVLPDDAGLQLPASGSLVVQWHHANDTDAPRDDKSELTVCTVPAATRPNIAGLTILGTENFNGAVGAPPGTSQFGGTCVNDSGANVTILSITPHMHRIGARMTTVIERAAGDSEVAFDTPFQFGEANNYAFEPTVVMLPGDAIRSTCTFENTTGMNVLYGQSAQQEMCFSFAIAYPVPALDNGVLSLLGATNTCW